MASNYYILSDCCYNGNEREDTERIEMTKMTMFNMLVSKVSGKAPNLRKPSSCRFCVHNRSGYVSTDCDIHPVGIACYSSELVCDDYTRSATLPSLIADDEDIEN